MCSSDEQVFFDWPPRPDLMRAVAGIDAEPGGHVRVDAGGIRSFQRFTLRDCLDGIALLFWPGEDKSQATQLYRERRAERMLAVANSDGWQEVAPRPHLSYWNARPKQRLYLHCEVPVAGYLARWCDEGPERVRDYGAAEVRDELWPWLKAEGFAAEADESELEPFLARAGARPVRLRPGLRFLRIWTGEEVAELTRQGELALAIRSAINRVLAAADDGQLPLEGDRR